MALTIGSRAPDIEILVEGKSLRLHDLTGQTIVLAFTSDWDPAWAQQLSLYESIFEEFPEKRDLLRISQEGVWCRVGGEDEQAVRFPLIREFSPNSGAAKEFGLEGGQAVFVLDSEHVVQWRHIAASGTYPTAAEFRDALRKLHGPHGFSRRRFLIGAVAATIAFAVLPRLARSESIADRTQQTSVAIKLKINGEERSVTVDPRTTLLDALRERLGLMGTKKGCDHGQCGACTVHINGRRVNSCLTLAMQAEGSDITTIEGLARNGKLHPVQEAFIKHDGFQCGYCTPGQIMSAVACIKEGHADTDEDIKEWMSGNICRCGAYVGICEAIKEAKGAMAG